MLRISFIRNKFPLKQLKPLQFRPLQLQSIRYNSKMSGEENLLLIPGPIVISERVRQAQAIQSLAHTSPEFISIFQKVLVDLRKLFKSSNPKDQGLVIAGSGTLGWDITASNLIYPGEDVLVLSTGFFSDSFAECLKVYGANVDILTAKPGEVVPFEEIESQLQKKSYKAITITHVDTSTAVVSDVGKISSIVKSKSPDSLIIVDGVCSVGVEDIEFSKWGLDYVLSASQKAIGVPSGLSISFISERAITKALNRPTQSTFFASLVKWLPIVQNYEAGKPSYFATPAIQTVNALKASLEEILESSLDQRFAKHHETSSKFKKNLESIGLKLVSTSEEVSANGLTAVYYPEGIKGSDLLPLIYKKGIVLAGGIHKDIKDQYFRIGHMGVSALDDSRGDTDKAFKVIKESLEELGYKSK
ncbi:Serine hydroxymethyltransferase [Wickerhamomyces ciferrii]|uniref:alanine--glyoxylate transaminase n=1 Tax=Wickerhamomyces ciferrii (strain ATCC 14091 / BCRC 22168 / CBS 111 / JCM 3599 / NBRC 0793 / NRRL Y-1031 F-60-10) TaxID=1206466 RepID=K0KUN6_WICCF|nr:Serine hydroxymethyltransferase [Wickerhamomyces ciferrii]CCH44888.1 Serine hydroxymethyltransferase [Wickerhamomyces ciferrii]